MPTLLSAAEAPAVPLGASFYALAAEQCSLDRERNIRGYGGILPVYDIAALAEALQIDQRQLDNLLSRNSILGVDRRRRGVTRRVTPEAAATIRLAWDLVTHLRVPSSHALELAATIERDAEGAIAVGRFGALRFDLAGLRDSTLDRLDSAVEAVGTRRRGRPARPLNLRE
jgi:hypothetical protein